MKKITAVSVDLMEGYGNDAQWVVYVDDPNMGQPTMLERKTKDGLVWRASRGDLGTFFMRADADDSWRCPGFGGRQYEFIAIDEAGNVHDRKFLGAWSSNCGYVNAVYADLKEPLIEGAGRTSSGGLWALSVKVSAMQRVLGNQSSHVTGVWVRRKDPSPKFVPMVKGLGIKNYTVAHIITDQDAMEIFDSLKGEL